MLLDDKYKSLYKRQLQLPGFTEASLKKMQNSSVLVVGAGGLGSVVLTYLSRSGLGRIGIADYDCVDESNLHRQFLYHEADIGKLKARQASSVLKKGNNSLIINTFCDKIDENNAEKICAEFDIIADCSDNFKTRYLLNDTARKLRKPLAFASVSEYEGQVTVLHYQKQADYRMLFPVMPKKEAAKGILPALLAVTGGMQSAEIFKIITGTGKVLDGKLLVYNILTNSQNVLNFV